MARLERKSRPGGRRGACWLSAHFPRLFVALLHVWLISHDIMPWYKYSGITAALLWTWLGVLWRQPSIWILNIIMILIYLKGMFNL